MCAVYGIPYHILHYTVYNPYHMLYSVQCTPHIKCYTVYNLHHMLYSVHCTVYHPHDMLHSRSVYLVYYYMYICLQIFVTIFISI